MHMEDLKKMNENAELEAAADNAVKNEKGSIEKINRELSYEVELTREYDFDGERIRKVDLSGLKELTTVDGTEIDQVMERMNHEPRNKFRDLTYTKHIAMRVTGLPVEFFNNLIWKDMERIKNRITLYFLF
ncbi:MAG: hypothetical protein BHV88_09360 [Clostridiales bacterium 41_12_two_minus]|nr:MAG: hypothetical protein BHV88_09360 [Clostridiales bacterium 41_12_two_minus]DAM48363.1 MAG TPA: tail assembly chaperone protein [Caudoviricetes sp.]